MTDKTINADSGCLVTHATSYIPLDLYPSTVPSALLYRAHSFQGFVDANEKDQEINLPNS